MAGAVTVLGVSIHSLDVAGLIGQAVQRVACKDKSTVLYANVHVLNTACSDPELRAILNAADLVYCDGAGVALGARLLGHRLPEHEIHLGIPVHRIPYWGGQRFFVAPQVLHWVRNFDVVHVHNTDFFCDFLAHTRSIHRKPLLLATHGGFFHTSDVAWKRLYFRTITRGSLRQFNVVAADSEADRQRFAPICSRVLVMPDGVDLPTYSAVEKHVESGLLVYVGRLAYNKRIDALLRACALARECVPHVHLTLIGMDFEGIQSQLQAMAGQLGIQDVVRFLGVVTGEVLRENLSRANLFVSASEYESFGLSVIEAMATGTVPVVNRLPPFEQFIEPGRNGWFCDFSCPDQAAQTLVEALQCPPARLEEMGRQARVVAAQYDWARIAKEWESLYYQAMETYCFRGMVRR